MASKSDFRRTHYAAAITFGLIVTISAAIAHEGATGIVKTRMDAMKAAADALKPVGAMAKGKRPYDASKVAEAARVVHEHAQKIPELFPPDTASKESEARDLIWTDWADFKTKAHDLEVASDALTSVAQAGSGDTWKPAFTKVMKTCKSCHERYREEKEDHRSH